MFISWETIVYRWQFKKSFMDLLFYLIFIDRVACAEHHRLRARSIISCSTQWWIYWELRWIVKRPLSVNIEMGEDKSDTAQHSSAPAHPHDWDHQSPGETTVDKYSNKIVTTFGKFLSNASDPFPILRYEGGDCKDAHPHDLTTVNMIQ